MRAVLGLASGEAAAARSCELELSRMWGLSLGDDAGFMVSECMGVSMLQL